MSLSLAAEPRRKGLFEPHFWSRPSSNYPPNVSLLPLVFSEPLPTVCLVDRSLALRGRLDSDAATDIHAVRAVDGRIRQEERRVRPFDPTAGVLASLSLGGTVIPVHNGDLLLVVQGGNDSVPSSRRSSRAPSRPPSSSITDLSEKPPGRTPSIRVKPGSSQVLDRKSSMARRSSLPALSNRPTYVTSETSTDRPLRALVQAGTLNNLVDILVHGLKNICVSVADDNGEMSLREGTRELVVDRKEFSKVWWNVFRSFVTPLVFFEVSLKCISLLFLGDFNFPPFSSCYERCTSKPSLEAHHHDYLNICQKRMFAQRCSRQCWSGSLGEVAPKMFWMTRSCCKACSLFWRVLMTTFFVFPRTLKERLV